jgi:hypothetical protein
MLDGRLSPGEHPRPFVRTRRLNAIEIHDPRRNQLQSLVISSQASKPPNFDRQIAGMNATLQRICVARAI